MRRYDMPSVSSSLISATTGPGPGVRRFQIGFPIRDPFARTWASAVRARAEMYVPLVLREDREHPGHRPAVRRSQVEGPVDNDERIPEPLRVLDEAREVE